MQKPDATRLHHPAAAYLRDLVAASGLSQRAVSLKLGISDRVMRYYLSAPGSPNHRFMPYPEQFTLEHLVHVSDRRRIRKQHCPFS